MNLTCGRLFVVLLSAYFSLGTEVSRGQLPNLVSPQLLPSAPSVNAAAGAQKSVAVCLGSTSTLLVFEDNRAGDKDIFGLRIDANGTPLDPIPFPISKDPANQTTPKVAWNGQNWLVVYTNEVDPGSGYFAPEFAARRVSPQGQVLDATRISIAIDSSGGNFGVASDGNNWVVLFTGYSVGNTGLRAKRISAAGLILDPAGVVVVPGGNSVTFGSNVAFAQNQYLFTWSDNGLRGRRFTPQLQAIDPAPVLIASGGDGRSLSGNGSEFFLASSVQNAPFTSDIVGRRLDANLNTIGSPTIAITTPSSAIYHTDPRVTWDGTQWIVGWLLNGTQDARAARVSANGLVMDPGGVALPDGSPNYLYGHALGALPGGGAIFVWDDIRSGGSSLYDIFGVTFTASGVVGIERCYSLGSEAFRTPRIAMGANQALVTFRAEFATSSKILAHRTDAFGWAIDTQPIVVAVANHAGLYAGGVAWNGSVYLVTWSDAIQGIIFARRLLADGTFLDANPIPVLLGGSSDVAALGSDFLVTALRAPLYPQYVNAYGARVRGIDGLILDSSPLTIAGSYATRARVAILGGSWIVLTERHATHDSNFTTLEVSFVAPNGSVTASANAGILNVQDWGSVDIASSGTSALVVGQSGSNWTNTDIFATRILPGGTIAGPMFNVTGSVGLGQSRATVGWSGTEYVVAYQTLQNNLWSYDREPDIYASRISETGALLDPVGFPVWNGEDYEVNAEAGSMGNGRILFASSIYIDGVYGSHQIALRGMRPAGLTNYGTGTPGCLGPQHMDANSKPYVGNAGFTVTCDSAPANALGLTAIGLFPDVPGSDPFGLGILLHVNVAPPTLFQNMYSDAQGVGSIVLPIPLVPSLVGVNIYCQSAFAWSGSCTPSLNGLSSSDGLAIQIQNP